MKKFRIIALTPSGLPNSSIAIAATRAGELGVLDLEYNLEKNTAHECLSKLANYSSNDFGIKINVNDIDILNELLPERYEHFQVVILTYDDPDKLKNEIPELRRRNFEVLLECTSLDQARISEQIEIDGIIAKGHEAGGRIGNETSFVLLQKMLNNISVPVWAHGGIGLHTAAACFAAGAAGVVLDSQLTMLRESPIHENIKDRLSVLDGSETICIGSYRVYSRPGNPVIKELNSKEKALTKDGSLKDETASLWRQTISRNVGWDSIDQNLFLFGQDIAFASSFASSFKTVGGVIEAIHKSIESHCRAAYKFRPLYKGSPLAQSHGTQYPVVQGPMARISDTPAFIDTVAGKGALPFVAAAQLSGNDLDCLLQETLTLVKDKPWGVGLLGFIPPDLYREQIKAVLKHRPPFALIAGGQPGQAMELEQNSISTYLHVPSPGLLKIFLDKGIRRFVFEGRESGGHVGPRCSFILWETAIDILMNFLSSSNSIQDCHVLFAGGIHDARSASMVAAMAAPLAEKGLRVGIQLGSAYLFTREAVETGAIVQGYQEEIIDCDRTTLLETGPGHASRCVETPYVEFFEKEKRRFFQEGLPEKETRQALENMNLGRLRIAAKGITRKSDSHLGVSKLISINDEEQRNKGIYMVGQLTSLRNEVLTIDRLHNDISEKSTDKIEKIYKTYFENVTEKKQTKPCDIAIIGMECIFPKAPNLQTYWENILNNVNAIREIPKDRWDWRLYYDPDRSARDKIDSKWGAFIDDIPFDPMQHGIPPNSISSIEPLQLLALEVVKWALENAGYIKRPFPRERTSVIFGISGAGELGQSYSFRSTLPMYFGNSSQEIVTHFNNVLPEWTEDSFSGILMNVTSGRIANRFDLGGLNCTVDAACASSLSAIYLGVRELEARASDIVIVGSADCMQNPFTYLCFSKTQALSPRGCCNPFDEDADGIVLGEGLAAVILKRLSDAERDGDRIYAVIKGVAASSDGKDKSLTAPRKAGQVKAIDRAYTKANISPATVGLIEAHATGTSVGDRVEIESLNQVFRESHSSQKNCAVGSVKSMIGHTKSSAGLAGLIKVAMALHHKVLPPTDGVENPNDILKSSESPFYANTRTRPWIHHSLKHPHRAGVNAFGFGGTNYHVVLEEYTQDFMEHLKQPPFQKWPCETLIWKGASRQEILDAIVPLEKAIAQGANPLLSDLAFTLYRMSKKTSFETKGRTKSLSVVATSIDDLKNKLVSAIQTLSGSSTHVFDQQGIYFSEVPLAEKGKIAFLFPGQGSQYINMLSDLLIQFPEMRDRFERSDSILKDRLSKPLSTFIYPPSTFNEEDKKSCENALKQTQIAQPAIGTAGMAMFHLLKSLGIEPDLMAGHSYGEYVALCAAGVIEPDDMIVLSEARGRFMAEVAGSDSDPGTMAAINAGKDVVADNIKDIEDVWIANLNAPNQTVISGTIEGIKEAIRKFKDQNIRSHKIAISCAMHSPIVAQAGERLRDFLSDIRIHQPCLKVFSNTTAKPYPQDPNAISEKLVQHLISRVEFVQEIEAMYEDGARIFVEVGPGRVLSGLVDRILDKRPHLAAISNLSGRSGLIQLQHLIGQLVTEGVHIKMEKIFMGRSLKTIDLEALYKEPNMSNISSFSWVINGTGAKQLSQDAGIKPDKKITPLEFSVRSKTANTSTPSLKKDNPRPQVASSDKKFSSNNKSSQTMLQYQQLMQRFLETQKNVMMSYLQRRTSEDENLTTDEDIARKEILKDLLSKKDIPEQIRSTEQVVSQSSTDGNTFEQPESLKSPIKKVLNKEAITSKLLGIVSERTGYPQDMLDLNSDLEADLGIDSIKRVEILGLFTQFLFPADQSGPPEETEELNQVKTLQEIIDWAETYMKTSKDTAPKEIMEPPLAKKKKHAFDVEKNHLLPRFKLRAVKAPQLQSASQSATSRVIMITDDQRGIARELMDKLKQQGYKVVRVLPGEDGEEIKDHCYRLEDDSEESITNIVKTIKEREGAIGGLIHLLPLRKWASFKDLDLTGWRNHLQLLVKPLFNLLKLLEDDLKQAAKEGGAFVMSAVGMGGSFAIGLNSDRNNFFPGHGGISGFLKTAAVEWPEVRFKTVDLKLSEPISDLADHLLSEINAPDELLEVGYDGKNRLSLDLVQEPLDQKTDTRIQIDSSWIILITGGARGITAEIACKLARLYKPTLILAGLSPLPPEKELDETFGLEDPQEIKSALIKIMKQQGVPFTVGDIEAAYRQLCKEREIRSNLAALRAAGAKIEYYSVDVRDEQEFGKLIDNIYQTNGRLDGVIHGAGIIEDKLIGDKSWESFYRVFGTKTESAFILSRKLRVDTLKFLVLFSSVAGRFGNRGQCDYTAANEVINKLAVYLDAHWPARVVAVNWGPWDKSGMVSDQVKRQFEERGVGLIRPSDGAHILNEEIKKGFKGEVEVVMGDGPWRKDRDLESDSIVKNDVLPLLKKMTSFEQNNGFLEVEKCLNPIQDIYLQDHLLDGKPVLPAAMAIELIAEVAQMGWPQYKIANINEIRVLKGIILNNNTLNIRVLAQLNEKMSSEKDTVELEFVINDPIQPNSKFYQASVVMTRNHSQPAEFEPPTDMNLRPFSMSLEETYGKWMFHGPRFQHIRHIEGISDKGMITTIIPSSPKDCLAGMTNGDWLLDPVVLDCGFQHALIWGRKYIGITALPSRFQSIRLFKPFSLSSSIRCFFKILKVSGKSSIHADIFFVDNEGQLMVVVKGFESTGSKKLNRLAGYSYIVKNLN